jgi:hypothetical protein
MFRNIIKTSKFLLVLLLFVSLAGCGSASSSSSDTDDTVDYTGDSTISGQVYASKSDVAAVYGDDEDVLGTLSLSKSVAYKSMFKTAKKKGLFTTLTADNSALLKDGKVVLYAIKDDGTTEATGITATVVDGSYELTGVADGNKYIIKIQKLGKDQVGNDQMLEQSAFVYIPENTTAVEKEVTETTSYIVAAIVEQVRDKALEIETVDVEQLNNTLAILEAVLTSSIEAGSITVGSSVREASDTDITNYAGSTSDYEVGQDQKDAVSALEGSEAVRNENKKGRIRKILATPLSDLSDEEAKEAAKYVWGVEMESASDQEKGGSDGGIPEFYTTLFAQGYKSGETQNLSQVAEAFNKAFNAKIVQITAMIENVTADIKADIQSQLTTLAADTTVTNIKTTLVSNGLSKLQDLYAYYNNPKINEDGSIVTANPVYEALFPSTNRYTQSQLTSDTTKFNVFQIVQFILASPYVSDMLEIPFDNYHGPDFDSIVLMQELGLFTPSATGLYLTDKRVRSTEIEKKVAISGGGERWEPARALSAEIELLVGEDITATPKVYIKYTKKNGSEALVEVPVQQQGGESGTESLANKSYINVREYNNNISAASFKAAVASYVTLNQYSYRLSPWDAERNGETIIDDFKTGTAEIVVKIGGVEQSLENNTIKLVGVEFGYITWQTPKGQSMDELKKAQEQGNYYGSGDYVPEAFEIGVLPELKWTAPEAKGDGIPEGYSLKYVLEIRLNGSRMFHDRPMPSVPQCPITQLSKWEQKVQQQGGDDGYGQSFENGWSVYRHDDGNGNEVVGWLSKDVWETWDDNRLIDGTTFKVPSHLELPATSEDSTANYQTFYEVSVRPLLVEDDTQQVVFEGTRSQTRFFVLTQAEIDALDWNITISGKVKFPTDIAERSRFWDKRTGQETIKAGKWKIGLFRKGYHDNQGFHDWNTDYDNANNARVPLRIATIGTTAEAVAATYELNYTFDSISISDELINQNEDVEIMVWYDLDVADTSTSTGVDKLDFARYNTIEPVLCSRRNYRLRYEAPHMKLEYSEEVDIEDLEIWQIKNNDRWRNYSTNISSKSTGANDTGARTVDIDLSN